MYDDNSESLLKRVSEGDPDAENELFNLYLERLRRVARSRMSRPLQRRIDSMDVAQSALGDFFKGAREGRFYWNKRGDLWRLLAAVTINKVRAQARYHSAAKRDMADETSISASGSGIALPASAVASDPSPEDVVMLTEILERALVSLSDKKRQIMGRYLQGDDEDVIEKELGCSNTMIERAVRAFREKVKALVEEDRDQ